MTERLEQGIADGPNHFGPRFSTMRRDHRRPFDMEAEEANDVTQQFWGATRGWAADGEPVEPSWDDRTPRSLQSLKSTINGMRRRPSQPTRRMDATGRIDRTRSHGMPRPVVEEQLEITRREATLGELAAGWIDDDDWPELDLLPALPPTRPNPQLRPAPRHETRVHDAFDDDDEFEIYPEDVDDDDDLVPLSPVAPLASKLGLGAVDPLLARLGAIVVAGILILPVALSTRGGSHDALASAGDVPAAAAAQTQSVVGSTAMTAQQAAAPVATQASVSASATVSASTAAVAATTSSNAVTTQSPAVASTSAVTSDQPQAQAAVATTAPAADVPQSESVSTNAPAEVATVTEPAERLAPDCSLKYEAGQGDSWYRIADAAGVTPRALMDQNLADLDSPIFPGDAICLPAGATIPEHPVVTTAPPAPTTTAAPTTTVKSTTTTTVKPTTTTAPPPPPASASDVQALIREIWPDELEDKALAIAWRESNYKATAFNGSCCYGVFQINWSSHKSWLGSIGITSTNDLLDARKNITAAYAIYQRAGGWGPWGG